MNEIKAGDSVLCVEEWPGVLTKGKVYEVCDIRPDGLFVTGDDGNVCYGAAERFSRPEGFNPGDPVRDKTTGTRYWYYGGYRVSFPDSKWESEPTKRALVGDVLGNPPHVVAYVTLEHDPEPREPKFRIEAL